MDKDHDLWRCVRTPAGVNAIAAHASFAESLDDRRSWRHIWELWPLWPLLLLVWLVDAIRRALASDRGPRQRR
ncbi:MAG: hypothetical protein EXS08_05875 [Planctomycetes bacterium]|nr:hypothetical protein [Planctomycetota bacterium]